MIEEGLRASEIANNLNLDKQLISYHIRRLKECGYVTEIVRDVFKLLEVTQPGKKFLAMYENALSHRTPVCRAENIRFKAEIIKMPSSVVDWRKIEMNNWGKYVSQSEDIKVHINMGKIPTIEFIPGPVDGDNPDSLRLRLLQDCTDVARNLEDRLDMKLGRLELSSRGEWVIYDPVARAFSKYTGQVNVKGIGKVNASGPRHIGEFEFHDPRAAADYLAMPRRIDKIEQRIDKVFKLPNKKVRLPLFSLFLIDFLAIILTSHRLLHH
ncbi:MAG: winged helix-turn-helix domain-containing protein [Nitrososphaeraceae archaeon]